MSGIDNLDGPAAKIMLDPQRPTAFDIDPGSGMGRTGAREGCVIDGQHACRLARLCKKVFKR